MDTTVMEIDGEQVEFAVSSGNLWADFGLPDADWRKRQRTWHTRSGLLSRSVG